MKKGFTLIELLAVIVILAIVLVIAVPQILKVIDQSRRDSLAASVRMYASALETNYLVSQTSNTPLVAPIKEEACPLVVDFNDGTCTYDLTVINDAPVAMVTIVGSGKFTGYTGIGTKSGDVTVMNSNEYDTEAPTVAFETNGSSTYIKSMSIKVTVNDSNLNTNSLKYQWTTSTTEPSKASFSSTFLNGSSIDTPSNATGSYYLWILAKDNSGNTIITRTGVFNLDNIAPVIVMLGSGSVTIGVGDTYTDAGATASDNIDGTITQNIVKTGAVNASIAGTYTITYRVNDTAGNTATSVTRTIVVSAPLLSTIISPSLTTKNGSNYYTGGNPNNWIEFGQVSSSDTTPLMWRIIKSDSNGIKIIYEGTKNGTSVPTADGRINISGSTLFAWDTTNSNKWERPATIKTTLQNWFDNTLYIANRNNYIEQIKWCIGGAYSASGNTTSVFSAQECINQTTAGGTFQGLTASTTGVGLISVSEFISTSSTPTCNNPSVASQCNTNNFLWKSSYDYWTQIAYANNNYAMWYVRSYGIVQDLSSSSSTTASIRPIINLKASVIYDVGSGTLTNPYKIK